MRSKLWRHFHRKLKHHFGPTARRVAVRPQLPWAWSALLVCALVLLGYLAGYWQFAASDFANLAERVELLMQENQSLQSRIVHHERQLQVERAAQDNLAKEMAMLQAEDMRIKEDIEFYKSILKVTSGSGELKLHSFKISKGATPNQYAYNILLMQSGRHDKLIQGQLTLTLVGTQSGEPVSVQVSGDSEAQGIKINFKYYQRVEGSFTIPQGITGQALQASFVAAGATRPYITKKMDLPD